MIDRIRFYRFGYTAMLRGARIAFVHFGRSSANVTVVGARVAIHDLTAAGVLGCTKITPDLGGTDAFFPRVTKGTLLAQLREAFDIVVDDRLTTSYRLELEFVAALIEWGCGPLPTLAEINAYDRGVADARRAVAEEHEAEHVRARIDAHNAAVLNATKLSTELAELRATVQRQREQLAARPVETSSLERAERQRAADAQIATDLAARHRADAAELAITDGPSARAAESLARHRAAVADLIATAIRETEVVR